MRMNREVVIIELDKPSATMGVVLRARICVRGPSQRLHAAKLGCWPFGSFAARTTTTRAINADVFYNSFWLVLLSWKYYGQASLIEALAQFDLG